MIHMYMWKDICMLVFAECGSVKGANQAKKKLIEADEADALRELLLLQVILVNLKSFSNFWPKFSEVCR